MTLEPFNRHLSLKPVASREPEKKESAIIVPEDYVARKKHDLYEITSVAADCIHLTKDDVGRTIVVDNSMVEKIDINDDVFYLLLENYIYGALDTE